MFLGHHGSVVDLLLLLCCGDQLTAIEAHTITNTTMTSNTDTDNEYYKTYNPSVASTHNWRTVHTCLPQMEQALRSSREMRILDVGCGPGSITHDVFASYGESNAVVGLDTPAELIQACRTKYCSGGDSAVDTTNHNTLKFVQGSAYKLPFADGEFDIVYCHQVLIHLKDPIAAVREMLRVLRRSEGNALLPSYLFVCEGEKRSFFFHPLSYQPTLTEYLNVEASKYTRESFGLGLLELFRSATEDSLRHPKSVSLDTVSWCISDEALKKHFASMYVDRIASRKDVPDVQRFIDAWTNWSEDPVSAAAAMNGILIVVY